MPTSGSACRGRTSFRWRPCTWTARKPSRSRASGSPRSSRRSSRRTCAGNTARPAGPRSGRSKSRRFESQMQRVKPALLRGFDQEYLPQEQLQFNALIDLVRKNFELFGFLPIETPSAERTEVLTSKGGVEKEIYALSRLAAGPEEDEASAKGALRFDLTVPLARYVAMRERELAFPFRRYQIQRVWRGETPQANKGRFREFYQCDIDIIGRDKLSYLAEAEIPSVIYSVFKEMAIGEFRIRINNRKVLKGLLAHFKIAQENAANVLRILDKVEKESTPAILSALEKAGVAGEAARLLYGLT